MAKWLLTALLALALSPSFVRPLGAVDIFAIEASNLAREFAEVGRRPHPDPIENSHFFEAFKIFIEKRVWEMSVEDYLSSKQEFRPFAQGAIWSRDLLTLKFLSALGPGLLDEVLHYWLRGDHSFANNDQMKALTPILNARFRLLSVLSWSTDALNFDESLQLLKLLVKAAYYDRISSSSGFDFRSLYIRAIERLARSAKTPEQVDQLLSLTFALSPAGSLFEVEFSEDPNFRRSKLAIDPPTFWDAFFENPVLRDRPFEELKVWADRMPGMKRFAEHLQWGVAYGEKVIDRSRTFFLWYNFHEERAANPNWTFPDTLFGTLYVNKRLPPADQLMDSRFAEVFNFEKIQGRILARRLAQAKASFPAYHRFCEIALGLRAY
jgi:hypothetical protein